MLKTILIVEDEQRMRKLISDYFIREGFKVLEAENGEIAIEMFKEQNVNLIILDIMIPLIDGFEVCKQIRSHSDVPIIMLTAKSEESDKLTGFGLGADDYVTKPFSPKVLVAKAKALLKRVEGDIEEIIEIGGIKINQPSHEVSVDNEIINLSPKEYDLLLFFIKNKGIVLSREKLLDNLWGYSYEGDLRTVDTHIKRLREKMNDKASFITTVRGSGYMFDTEKQV